MEETNKQGIPGLEKTAGLIATSSDITLSPTVLFFGGLWNKGGFVSPHWTLEQSWNISLSEYKFIVLIQGEAYMRVILSRSNTRIQLFYLRGFMQEMRDGEGTIHPSLEKLSPCKS